MSFRKMLSRIFKRKDKSKQQIHESDKHPEETLDIRGKDDGMVRAFQCRLVSQQKTLTRLIETEFGLSDELYSVGILTDEQHEVVDSLKQSHERNSKLICYLKILQWSNVNYQQLMSALNTTNQQHVAHLFQHDGECNQQCPDNHPLSDQQMLNIRTNYKTLLELLDPIKDGLVDKLYSVKVINTRQKEYIEAQLERCHINKRLLNIIMKRSVADYNKFLKCLQKRYSHLLPLLQLDNYAAVAVVHAESNLSLSNEEQIVASFRLCSLEDQQRLITEARILAMKTQNSIAVYIICLSLKAVQDLDKMYEDGSLKSILEEMFTYFLHTSQTVVITGLHWTISNYNNCLHIFYTAMGLYAGAYKLATAENYQFENENYLDECSSVNCFVSSLPLELREMLLIKAHICMFKALIKLTSRDADVIGLISLFSVCQDWWLLITNRPFIRRQIRRTINYVIRPYSRHPNHVDAGFNLSDDEGRRVWGVVVLNNRLFAVDNSSLIEIFDITTSGQRLKEEDIDVNKYIESRRAWLRDIVCCSETQQLFAADYSNKRIIRVKIDSSDSLVVDVFIELNFTPGAMSTQSNRLLITPDPWSQHRETGYDSLYLYDVVDGRLLKKVPLQSHVTTLHAVETQRSTFITCHRGREDESQHHEVDELDGEGRVLRVFGGLRGDGPHQLHRPRYLLLDDTGRVLVADFGNRRILLLNQRLQLERVLLTVDDKLDTEQNRMCFNRQTGELIVGHFTFPEPGRVDVFNVLKRV